jgi:hypothetical protein
VYPAGGDPKAAPLTVAPASRQAVHLGDIATGQAVSAVIELDGGEAVVELTVAGPLGQSTTPCASSASTRWYLAEGVTTKDATEILMLFNPFPDDAVVDVSFATEDGEIAAQALTGLAVPGGSMTAVNVGEHAQRRQQVATSVTARAGRLVVGRIQSFDGSAGRKGLATTLASPSPGSLWYFPDGIVTDGVAERYQLFNPGDAEARVEVDLALERGQAEPLFLTVPSKGRVTVSANDEARIPKSVPYAVAVRSLNGVGVVVERAVFAGPPSRRTGVAIAPGARLASLRWGFAAGAADDTTEEFLVFQNPGSRPASVSVSLLADGSHQPLDALQGLPLGPGERRSVRLNDTVKRNAVPLVVESTQPIVVERSVSGLKGPGISKTVGIPLRG